MKIQKFAFAAASICLLSSSPVFAEKTVYHQEPEDARRSDYTMYRLLENENAIYWFDSVGSKLMYLDESSMSWYPLCSKPDCVHEVDYSMIDYTSDCDAFIPCTVTSPIVQWNDRIYYFGMINSEGLLTIESLNTDGTDHRRETTIDAEIIDGGNCQTYIHRGKAYLTVGFYGEKSPMLYIYDLNQPEDEPKALEIEDQYITLIEGYMYYDIADEEGQTASEYRRDLNGENPELCASGIRYGLGAYLEEDAAYKYLPEEGIVKTDYNSGKSEVIWNDMNTYDCETFQLLGDGEYLFLRGGSEYGLQGTASEFLILNPDGQLLKEITIPNWKEGYSKLGKEIEEILESDRELGMKLQRMYLCNGAMEAYVGSTADYLFFTDYYGPVYYMEKSEISSGFCELKEIEMDPKNW